MQIRARMSMSADGYVTTPGGWPALTADPAFVSGESHGIREFLEGCEQALMGRTTFEPALGNDRWPWPALDVFVLGSQPSRPEPRTTWSIDSDPERLLESSAPPTRAATSTWSAAPARSRASAPSARSTSSSWSSYRCSSEAGCSSPRRSAPTPDWRSRAPAPFRAARVEIVYAR